MPRKQRGPSQKEEWRIYIKTDTKQISDLVSKIKDKDISVQELELISLDLQDMVELLQDVYYGDD